MGMSGSLAHEGFAYVLTYQSPGQLWSGFGILTVSK